MGEKVAAGLQQIKENRVATAIWQAAEPARANPFPLQVLFTILYRLMLDAVYIWLLSPQYGYSGFTTALLWPRYGASLLAAVLFAPVVVHVLNDRSPSSILVSFVNYLYFLPLASYFGCHGTQTKFFLVSMAYWAIFLLLQIQVPRIVFKRLPVQHMDLCVGAVTAFAALFVFAVSGKYTGFRFTLDFINVYEIRAEAASYDLPTAASYLLGVMPMLLAALMLYYLQKKKMLVLSFLIVTYLFLFSLSAQKAVFFFLFLVLAGYWFYRDWMLRWMPGLLVPAVGVLFIEHAMNGLSILSLFFRRMMYIPVLLSEKYAAFFSEHPLNLFQDGIMGKLSFDELYSIRIPKVIGEYMGDYWTSANNGLIGDMYANLPVLLGLLVMPLILVICFRVLDLAAARVNRRVVISFCVYYAVSFINSSWSTVLLTHGFLVACLMLYFFPKGDLPK